MKYYTKVEAVNIYNHIADTNQLSIIRGGGLLLKSAIDDIASKVDKKCTQILSTGASQGIFSSDTEEATKTLSETIRSVLRQEKYAAFTFLFDTITSDSYEEAREQLIALSRFRQLHTLSESADMARETQHNGASSYSGLRKAQFRWPDGKVLSAFDSIRFKNGTDNRQSIFKEDRPPSFAALEDDFLATNDLQSMSDNNEMRNLNNKIAVFYCDGNSFSAIQSDYIADSQDKDQAQKEFDDNIKAKRQEFLASLTDLFYTNNSAAFQTDKKECRIEVLLWGGDEMILVVPAWLGMLTLSLFYKQSSQWKIQAPGSSAEYSFKHSAGLVFASTKTPIMKLTQLARELADEVKERTVDGESGRSNDFFDYITLESVDYPTESLSKYLKSTFPLLDTHNRPFLRPCLSPSAILNAKGLLEALPRSQFYRHVQLLTSTTDTQEVSASFARLEKAVNAIDQSLMSKAKALVITLFGQHCELVEANPWGFIHLLQLWDYLEAPVQAIGTEE